MVFAVIAVALTVGFVVVVFQSITGDFVGGEVQIVWTISGFVGVLTVVAWLVAVSILQSTKKDASAITTGAQG